jgi:hypothetical protein
VSSALIGGKVFSGKFQVNRIIYPSLSVKRLDATSGTVHPNYKSHAIPDNANESIPDCSPYVARCLLLYRLFGGRAEAEDHHSF